jgi:hypothetical protein
MECFSTISLMTVLISSHYLSFAQDKASVYRICHFPYIAWPINEASLSNTQESICEILVALTQKARRQ